MTYRCHSRNSAGRFQAVGWGPGSWHAGYTTFQWELKVLKEQYTIVPREKG